MICPDCGQLKHKGDCRHRVVVALSYDPGRRGVVLSTGLEQSWVRWDDRVEQFIMNKDLHVVCDAVGAALAKRGAAPMPPRIKRS